MKPMFSRAMLPDLRRAKFTIEAIITPEYKVKRVLWWLAINC